MASARTGTHPDRSRRCSVGKLARGAVLSTLLVLALSFPGGARAAQVLVLGSHGHVAVRSDPFVASTGSGALAVPQMGGAAVPQMGGAAVPQTGGAAVTPGTGEAADAAASAVPGVLAGLLAQGQISSSDYSTDLNIWNTTVAAEATLTGTPAVELGAGDCQHRGVRHRRADDALAAAGDLPHSVAQPAVVEHRHDPHERATYRVQRLSDRVGVLPRSGHPAAGVGDLREGRRPLHGGPQRLLADALAGRRDDPARRHTRRSADLGVPVPVRKRQSTLDQRDVAGRRRSRR